jgi:beta-galactosidase
MDTPLGDLNGDYECGMLCDLLHTEGAEVLAHYGDDFYKGMPVLTRNTYGKGEAWYIASDGEEAFIDGLMKFIADHKGIQPVLDTPAGVEAGRRVKNGEQFIFLLNHNAEAATVELHDLQTTNLLDPHHTGSSIKIPARGSVILSASYSS